MNKTKEDFLGTLAGRRRELAASLLDGATGSELLEKGLSPIILVEMAQIIRRQFDPDFKFELTVEKEVVDISTATDDKVIGAKTGAKKKHITQTFTNEPLVGGCCEG